MNASSYTPGTTGGNKEWLGNELTILEPEETPFTSTIAKGEDAKGTLHEVVSDRLRKPRTTGTREGESGVKGGNKASNRARFGAYLHRWLDTFGVTDVQQAVSRKGGNAVTDDEYGDAKAKCVREVKRDIEATFLSNQDCQGGSDDEMRLRGLFKWLATTGTSVTPNIPSDFCTVSGAVLTSKATLLESDLNAVLKAIFDECGYGEFMALLGSDYVEDMDLFAVQDTAGGVASRYAYPVAVSDGSTKTVNLVVRIFETSFGRVTRVPSAFINVNSAGVHNATCAAILRRETWKASFLEMLHAVDDDEDAGGLSGYVKAIGGLWCKMPRANGYITNSLN